MALFKKKAEAKKPKAEAKTEKKVEKQETKKAAPAGKGTGYAVRILVRPIVTEKSARLEKEGKYVFEVTSGANKVEIKKAVKDAYGVDPKDVSVMRVLGKPVRTVHGYGRRKTWRKAVVTLKKGETIEVFSTKA